MLGDGSRPQWRREKTPGIDPLPFLLGAKGLVRIFLRENYEVSFRIYKAPPDPPDTPCKACGLSILAVLTRGIQVPHCIIVHFTRIPYQNTKALLFLTNSVTYSKIPDRFNQVSSRYVTRCNTMLPTGQGRTKRENPVDPDFSPVQAQVCLLAILPYRDPELRFVHFCSAPVLAPFSFRSRSI